MHVPTGEAKPEFGYFVLPLLHCGELIGRLDAKAHRAEGVFEIKSLYLKPGVKLDADDVHAVAKALKACAAWHGTPEVRITRSSPVALPAGPCRALLRPIA